MPTTRSKPCCWPCRAARCGWPGGHARIGSAVWAHWQRRCWAWRAGGAHWLQERGQAWVEDPTHQRRTLHAQPHPAPAAARAAAGVSAVSRHLRAQLCRLAPGPRQSCCRNWRRPIWRRWASRRASPRCALSRARQANRIAPLAAQPAQHDAIGRATRGTAPPNRGLQHARGIVSTCKVGSGTRCAKGAGARLVQSPEFWFHLSRAPAGTKHGCNSAAPGSSVICRYSMALFVHKYGGTLDGLHGAHPQRCQTRKISGRGPVTRWWWFPAP